jgi:hypothetical protein
MTLEWQKDELTALAILTLSVTISFFASKLSGFLEGVYDIYDLLVLTILVVSFVIVLSLRLSQNWIAESIWKNKMVKKSRSPLIGILREPQCENSNDGHPSTSFLSDDWKNYLQRQSLTTEILSIGQMSDKYSVIINPYGEVYPEVDPITLVSFKSIKQYIRNGGIFVCAGGLAFYYCWDAKTRRRVFLSKEIQPLVPKLVPALAQNILMPLSVYPPFYSIVDTLLKRNFGVSPIGDWGQIVNGVRVQTITTNQTNEDIRYVGNLSNVGGTNQIDEFRSATQATRRCIPLLRANVPNIGEVYPIAGIPFGRGLLIVCGMDLSSTNQVGNISIGQAEFEKICSSISSLLDGMRRGLIAYDWRS